MLKRTLTALVLLVVVAGFMICGYFVSPIFIDMLILLFLAGGIYEMFKCLKDAGYKHASIIAEVIKKDEFKIYI